MQRRTFLRHFTHSLAVPGVLGSMGFKMPGSDPLASLLRLSADQGRVLVMIYLDGGNDGLNTVIPLDQLSALNAVRPHVILPENRLLGLLGTDVALHPALTGLKSLFSESRLKIIQNVGYAQQNYSHFRSTDIWMSASDSHEIINSGWSGRMLTDSYPQYPEGFPNTEMPDPLSVEIGYGSSLLFQGASSYMGMVIRNTDGFYDLIDDLNEEIPNSTAGDKLRYIKLVAKQSQQYGEVIKAAADKVKSQADYPETGLAQQLKIVSRLIAGGLKTPMYLVRLGGFDTHDAQVESDDHTTGEHHDLLKELDEAIMAFMSDLETQGTADKVLGMTFSEFGRRIVSNASLGTDHGAAAPMFIFGNAVAGGIAGSNPIISPTATYEDNLELEYDFRQVYGSVMNQWMGREQGIVDDILFKNFEPIHIIGEAKEETLGTRPVSHGELQVYPNPVLSSATIRVSRTLEPVRVYITDMNGRMIRQVYDGKIADSESKFEVDTSHLPSGTYLVLAKGQKTNRRFRMLKL